MLSRTLLATAWFASSVQAESVVHGRWFAVLQFVLRGSTFAIPIAMYRPHFGPPAPNGEKNGRKLDFAPAGKRGKNGRKMGKLAQNWSKMAIFRFFGHSFPLFPGGAKIHFSKWGLYRAIGIAIQHCAQAILRAPIWTFSRNSLTPCLKRFPSFPRILVRAQSLAA